MNHRHILIQRSYPGFSQGNLCVGMVPMMWTLSKRTSVICFEQGMNSGDAYIRPCYYETQMR